MVSVRDRDSNECILSLIGAEVAGRQYANITYSTHY